eukprot:757768-Hanusia_phi.AAC.8
MFSSRKILSAITILLTQLLVFVESWSILPLGRCGQPLVQATKLFSQKFQTRGGIRVGTAIACSSQLGDEKIQHDRKIPMEPRPDFSAEEVMHFILEGLKYNDFPEVDSGLKRCFAFSNSMCRSAVGGDEGRAGGTTVEHFIKYASNPTFQSLVNCESYKQEEMNFLPPSPTRGALATQVNDRGDEREEGKKRHRFSSHSCVLLRKEGLLNRDAG